MGRPPRRPTAEEIHEAAQFAKGSVRSRYDGRLFDSDIARVCEAVGIPEATFRLNKHKPHWRPFIDAIRRAHAEAVVKVAGKRYLAAMSDKDTTRGVAREGFLKQNAGWGERVEIGGDPDRPLVPAQTIRFSPRDAAAVKKIISDAVKATRRRE